MDNNEVMMETVNTAAEEVAKHADHSGIIIAGLGFLGGVALTYGAVKGTKKLKEIHKNKKAAKAAKAAEATEK